MRDDTYAREREWRVVCTCLLLYFRPDREKCVSYVVAAAGTRLCTGHGTGGLPLGLPLCSLFLNCGVERCF